MENIKILTDSTCDLSMDLINTYNISVIPLLISMGLDTYKNGLDITAEDILVWSDKTGEIPKTAAPTIGDAIVFIKPFVEKDMDIIFFGISEAMSATCNVMRLAAQNLKYNKLHVVDSKNLSTGIGLQVIRAAEMASMGSSVEEILNDNARIKKNVRASFVVDTLTFLHRGGRCSGLTALIANTLKLKPEILVINGKMDVGKKYRGNQKSVILKYVQDREQELLNADDTRVFITHSECNEDVIDEVKEYLRGLNKFKEIIDTDAGGVISSHCGRNTLGVLYISN